MLSLSAIFLTLLLPFGLLLGTPKDTAAYNNAFLVWPATPTAPKIIPIPTTPPFPTIRTIKYPTITPTPTKILTPTPTIIFIPTLTPTPTSTPTTGNSVRDFIMNAINAYRKSKGLSTVQTDSYTCSFAKTRANEITSGFNHYGFTNRVKSKTLPYPSYSIVTENLAMTSNYKDVVNMWINSPGHAANMQKDTPYVCVENNGNYYAYEGWKP